LTAKSNCELFDKLKASWPQIFMRVFRASFIALLTAFVGCLFAFFVGDFLTRLAHMSNMEGGRGMFVVSVCAPRGILVGLVIGIISSILVRRQGLAGFFVARGWSLLIVCGLAGLLAGIPYLLLDNPPRIDGQRLELQFEVRAPATFKIPDQPDRYSFRVSLYADNRQNQYAFIDWNAIAKDAEHVTVPGHVPLLTHSKTRSLLASLGNEPVASQFIDLEIPPAPRKEDETWPGWIFATQRPDLSPVPEPEKMALCYRVRPVND
jgi:hypothetical protein